LLNKKKKAQKKKTFTMINNWIYAS